MHGRGRSHNTHGNLLDGSLLAEEIQLELRAVDDGVARYRQLAARAEQRGEAGSLKAVERLMLHWFSIYTAAIRKEQRATESNQQGAERGRYGPYIGLLNADKLAVLAMHSALGVCVGSANHQGETATKISLIIGRAVNAELNLIAVRADEDAWYELTHTDRARLKPEHINRIADKRIEQGMRWPIGNQLAVGAALLKLLIECASANPYTGDFKPAFENRLVQGRRNRTTRMIRLSDEAETIIAQGHEHRQFLRPKYGAMICLPIPWSASDRGGYLRHAVPMVKRQSPNRAPAAPSQTLYDGVNAINSTAWRINARMLDVMQSVYEAGGGYAGMVQADDLPKPPLPECFDTDPEIKRQWKKEAARVHRTNRERAAQRKSFLMMLDRARALASRDRFYLPHQLDFRGRAYPLPLYLHHHGDDLCRSLMEFADPREPGDDGQRWLRIHAANCCGIDKASFDARDEWTTSNLASFRGWASAPLENTGWMHTEKPWQALAAAFAIVHKEDAARLPVQLDGTCNGLQHYAALARDADGAEAVNLTPGEAPADVYSRVAAEVAEIVGRDGEGGNELAAQLAGRITRRIVKRPVMTSVYGVTEIGAREQIAEELNDETEGRFERSRYLAKITLEAIGRVCLGAGRIMDWLRACGRLITRSKSVIGWTTPMGMDVEQAYRSTAAERITTCLGRLQLHIAQDDGQPLCRRQVDGFPPNFIHSIDASHMLMTAAACHRGGVAFAAVHDSYWTHAGDTDALARILREQFVSLHRQPIVANLHEEMRRRWPTLEFPSPPAPGAFDIDEVMASSYIFS